MKHLILNNWNTKIGIIGQYYQALKKLLETWENVTNYHLIQFIIFVPERLYYAEVLAFVMVCALFQSV